jgi:hypothetical protein
MYQCWKVPRGEDLGICGLSKRERHDIQEVGWHFLGRILFCSEAAFVARSFNPNYLPLVTC